MYNLCSPSHDSSAGICCWFSLNRKATCLVVSMDSYVHSPPSTTKKRERAVCGCITEGKDVYAPCDVKYFL